MQFSYEISLYSKQKFNEYAASLHMFLKRIPQIKFPMKFLQYSKQQFFINASLEIDEICWHAWKPKKGTKTAEVAVFRCDNRANSLVLKVH